MSPTTILRGLAAGAGATGVMSIVMVVSERLGIMGRHPPERIVERGLAEAGQNPEPREVDHAAAAAHLGFGAAGGAGFAMLVAAVRPRAPVPLALLWALSIWLISYFGWVPALRILPSPPDDRPGRAWSMLLAHVAYGASLGALWRMASRR